MAYQIMYEGDGFIRKGPEPKVTGKEVHAAAPEKAPAKPEDRARKSGRFSFMRTVFGR